MRNSAAKVEEGGLGLCGKCGNPTSPIRTQKAYVSGAHLDSPELLTLRQHEIHVLVIRQHLPDQRSSVISETISLTCHAFVEDRMTSSTTLSFGVRGRRV